MSRRMSRRKQCACVGACFRALFSVASSGVREGGGGGRRHEKHLPQGARGRHRNVEQEDTAGRLRSGLLFSALDSSIFSEVRRAGWSFAYNRPPACSSHRDNSVV